MVVFKEVKYVMNRMLWCVLPCLLIIVLLPGTAQSQITYHLHQELFPGWGDVYRLMTNPPDTAYVLKQSQNVKSVATGWTQQSFVKFESDAAPVLGTILDGTTVTFNVWMQKTANWGALYPNLTLLVTEIANPLPPNSKSLCSARGSSPILTTVQKFTLSCTVSSQFVLLPPNAYRLDVGYYVGTTPGNHNTYINVYFEGNGAGSCGATNGNCDSTVIVPQPQALSTLYWKKDYVEDDSNLTIATATPRPSDQTPPTAPSNLAYSSLTSTSITLTWSSSTDSGGSGLAGYKIYRQRSNEASLPIASITWGGPFTDDTLQSATTYTFRVVAFDGAANDSAPSNSLTITTP